MSENPNMRIWSSVPKTDPKYTKAANVDGNRQTSIDGVYMVKLATEVLGPIGECWGYDVVDERYNDTKPHAMKVNDQDILIWEQVHTVRLSLWHGNKENTVTQFGHTKYRYKTKRGDWHVDTEAPKKSVTDAMKKCLSLLGVCSDVFMGEFDDVNYQQAAAIENDLKRADDRDAEYSKKLNELRADVMDGVAAIGKCPTIEAVGQVYGLKATKIDRVAPSLGLDPAIEKQPLDKAYHEARHKLEGNK